jgi:hypothetical protein
MAPDPVEHEREKAGYVREGGALLLITDHQPVGAAAQNLVDQLGVRMSNAVVVDKTAGNHLEGYIETNLEFTRANGRLKPHALIDGRDSTERVRRVVAFGGQSLQGPAIISSSRLQLPHGADRIEVMGKDAAVIGESAEDLLFTGVALGTIASPSSACWKQRRTRPGGALQVVVVLRGPVRQCPAAVRRTAGIRPDGI